MYRLTPRMLQNFRASLTQYHQLFSGGRCDSWQLEELIVNAIKSDTRAQHHVFWKEKGHDDKADMAVRTNGTVHRIQIKSGRIVKCRKLGQDVLELSGHRLGRFNGALDHISDYLNKRDAEIVSVPYVEVDDDSGRTHKYRIAYLSAQILADIDPELWEEKGKSSFYQMSSRSVAYTLQPAMSWQVWWRVPVSLIDFEDWWSI